MNDDYNELDDLDRALLALPLDAPPPGFRDAVLRATIYRSLPAQMAFGPVDIAAIGVALAVAVWFAVLGLTDRTFGASLALEARLAAHALAEPATLAWLATGAAIALLATLSNVRLATRTVRSGRA